MHFKFKKNYIDSANLSKKARADPVSGNVSPDSQPASSGTIDPESRHVSGFYFDTTSHLWSRAGARGRMEECF